MAPSTSAARCPFAAGRLLPVSTGRFRSLVLLLTLAATLPSVRAVIPAAARDNPVKGYINVDLYPNVTNSGTGSPAQPAAAVMTATTTALNIALRDAYDEDYVAYFPAGTYFINDTLQAYSQSGIRSPNDPDFNTPREAMVIIGQKSNRPVIKLASTAGGFNSATQPKAVVEFLSFNYGYMPAVNTPDANAFHEGPEHGYGQMLRDVIIDCSQGGSNNDGAIGLYFNQAQNSSIENVKVIATGALSGITGLPSRGWGAVNIEVVGGQYGIDTRPMDRPAGDFNPLIGRNNAGSVVAGVKLTNQTVSAVRQQGFNPLVLVGFEITSNTALPVITLVSSSDTGASAINLIDGRITRTGGSTTVLIDNAAEKNFYMREVYVTGTNNLVKSGANPTVTAAGTWKRIEEYSYCAAPDALPASDPEHKEAFNWITGMVPRQNTAEIKTAIHANSGAAPADLLARHVWASLPSPLDANVVDVTKPPHNITPGTVNDSVTVSHTALQAIINANPKVYLPKGIYRLTGPINLNANTTLIGTARYLTRIEVAQSWINQLRNTPALRVETPIITTTNSATATTHLGDLAVGVDVGAQGDLLSDWYVALHWRAGRDSMVHMGQPYRANTSTSRTLTNPHSLMKITNSGGGRWYFAGSIKTKTAGHAGYRILKVVGTAGVSSEPLWIYGLNLEHALGDASVGNGCADTYVEFLDASNIRIYASKSEFSNLPPPINPGDAETKSRLMWFNGCSNVGLYGSGAIRNGVTNKGVIEFTDCTHVLATHITPQRNLYSTAADDTVRDDVGGVVAVDSVAYPDVIALFKRGGFDTADEAAMTHN